MKKLIACYLRVSTDEQKTDLQKQSIEQYAKMKGLDIKLLRFYIDQGESGSKTSRPAFDEMMNEARRGNLSAVITYKFDRIGRSTVHLINVLEELKTLNVDFISITESVDTSSPMGKMIFGIFAVLAQFEREQLVMRTKAGMNAAKENGVKFGRAQKLNFLQEEQLLIQIEKYNGDIEKLLKEFSISRATVYRIAKKNGIKLKKAA